MQKSQFKSQSEIVTRKLKKYVCERKTEGERTSPDNLTTKSLEFERLVLVPSGCIHTTITTGSVYPNSLALLIPSSNPNLLT